MQKHVTFLHTSPVHVNTFGRLMKAADPCIRVEHVVREELLADAQRLGAEDAALVGRVHEAMKEAAESGASIVVCTCSTIGGAAERTPSEDCFVPIRIDRAMANRAVRLGPNILLVAALESTLGPTATLLQESAVALDVEVKLDQLLAQGAWSHFLRGDQAAYVEAIATAVQVYAPKAANVIVLAQASMSPVAEALSAMGIEILSSPKLGVESLIAQLHQ